MTWASALLRWGVPVLSAVDDPPSPPPPPGGAGSPASPRTEALRRLQQTLGTVHDRAMLIAWLEGRSRPGWPPAGMSGRRRWRR